MDLIAHMDISGRTGKVTGTIQQLALIARSSVPVFEIALSELRLTKTAQIAQSYGSVTIINRRMYREYNIRKRTYLRVKKFRSNHSVTGQMSEVRDQSTDLKRLNDANGALFEPQKESSINRSSFNRLKEKELMGRLRETLGPDEMARAGGHWLEDHVRKHGALVERALNELQSITKEKGARDNPAAWMEDLMKRWTP